MKKGGTELCLEVVSLDMTTNNLLQPMASSRESPELDLGDVVKSAEARCKQIQGAFFNCPAAHPPPPVSKLKK